ncbi:MAG: hypothetical protein WC728_11135 [Elusimicrobiota bacterium]
MTGLLLLAACGAFAAGFQLAPTSTTVLIGMPFEILGTAEFPAGSTLEPQPEAWKEKMGPWEILSVEFQPAQERGGAKAQDLRMRVAVFALGSQSLAPLDWTLKNAAGSASTLTSPAVEVTVQPPPPSLRDTGDIRDIRGPWSPRLWPWLLLLLAAAGAGAYAYDRYRKKKAALAAAGRGAVQDNRTFEEIALADLDALLTGGLPVKEFYDGISDILRTYLERRHNVQAMSMTTQDLQRHMIRGALEPKARSMTKNLLDRCDLAKFARYLPPEGERRKDCETGKEIVRILTPKKEPEGTKVSP